MVYAALIFRRKNSKNIFEAMLRQIFELVIQRELAFEVNAKFWTLSKSPHFMNMQSRYSKFGWKSVYPWFRCHVAQDYRLLFPEMSQLLRKFDVNQLVVFPRK